MVTQQEPDLAAERGQQIRDSGLYAVAAHYDPATGLVCVALKNGMNISFPKERAQSLAHATDEQLSEVQISPAGWSVDFPRIDDGFTIEGLLAGRFGSASWEREWAERNRESQAA
ncbi:MAG TPA: DUF2442 domain-containing protein [Acidobacteriaceae bacterium]